MVDQPDREVCNLRYSSKKSAQQFFNTLVAGMVCCVLMATIGCQLNRGSLMESPLTYREQVMEIQKIVPAGTPRDEAVTRLEEAGIKGSFGENKSVFYCGVWDRGKGKLWRIEVALLFDEQGNYLTSDPGQSTVKREAADASQLSTDAKTVPNVTTDSEAGKSPRAEQRARTAALLEPVP